MSMLSAHVACPCCMSKLHVNAVSNAGWKGLHCISISTLHVNVHSACHVHASRPCQSRMSMPMLYVHLSSLLPCPCCISMLVYVLHVVLSVHATYPWCMSEGHVSAACHAAWPCNMSMLHVHAACPCWCPYCMSMLRVRAVCQCFMFMSPCCMSILHKDAA